MHGDAFQLGGTFVINATGQVLYARAQSSICDFSDLQGVLEACQREFLYRMFKYVSKPPATLPVRALAAKGLEPRGDNFFVFKLSGYSEETLSSLASEQMAWDDEEEGYHSE